MLPTVLVYKAGIRETWVTLDWEVMSASEVEQLPIEYAILQSFAGKKAADGEHSDWD